MPLRTPSRSLRGNGCSSPDANAAMPKVIAVLPTSPDGVITYMGRSYEVKDLFPSLATINRTEEDQEVPFPATTVPRVPRPRLRAKRTTSEGRRDGSPAPDPRALARSSTSTMVPPRRPASSGAPLTTRMEALQVVAGHGRPRSNSMGGTVRHLFASQRSEDPYGIHSTSMRHWNYTTADVTDIIDDKEEFQRLKATLKKKGAITNEVLKQRIHYYVKAKKDRDAAGLVMPQVEQSANDRRRKIRRHRSDHGPSHPRAEPLMRKNTVQGSVVGSDCEQL